MYCNRTPSPMFRLIAPRGQSAHCLFRDDGVHACAVDWLLLLLNALWGLALRQGAEGFSSVSLCLTDHPRSCCIVCLLLLRPMCTVYVLKITCFL